VCVRSGGGGELGGFGGRVGGGGGGWGGGCLGGRQRCGRSGQLGRQRKEGRVVKIPAGGESQVPRGEKQNRHGIRRWKGGGLRKGGGGVNTPWRGNDIFDSSITGKGLGKSMGAGAGMS